MLFQRRQVHQTIVHINECTPAQRARGPRDPAVDPWEALSWCCIGQTSRPVSRKVETDNEGLVHDPDQQRGAPMQTKRYHIPLKVAQLQQEVRLPPVRFPQLQLIITDRAW